MARPSIRTCLPDQDGWSGWTGSVAVVDGLGCVVSFDALTTPQRLPVPGHVLIHRPAEHCDTTELILAHLDYGPFLEQSLPPLKKRVRDERTADARRIPPVVAGGFRLNLR